MRDKNIFKFLELYDFLGVQGNWFIWHFGYLLMGFKDAALKYVLKGKHGFVLCEDPRYLVPANTINIREVSVSQCNCRYPSYWEG